MGLGIHASAVRRGSRDATLGRACARADARRSSTSPSHVLWSLPPAIASTDAPMFAPQMLRQSALRSTPAPSVASTPRWPDPAAAHRTPWIESLLHAALSLPLLSASRLPARARAQPHEPLGLGGTHSFARRATTAAQERSKASSGGPMQHRQLGLWISADRPEPRVRQTETDRRLRGRGPGASGECRRRGDERLTSSLCRFSHCTFSVFGALFKGWGSPDAPQTRARAVRSRPRSV